MIDWLYLLQSRGVDHITSGKNVGKGHVNVACPFCGNDPSFHLGINLTTGFWSCWRSSDHAGRRPHRLLMRLLNISYTEANQIAGGGPDVGEWTEVVRQLEQGEQVVVKPANVLALPAEFQPITPTGVRKKFFNYLAWRKFDPSDIAAVASAYGLKCSLVGEFANRVIFPIYFGGRLVSWTGRSVYPDDPIRYRNLDNARAALEQTSWMYNCDAAAGGGELLVVVEGPMDAVKLDFYGKDRGIRAIALCGKLLSDGRKRILKELSARFGATTFALDDDAELDTFRYLTELVGVVPVQAGVLPPPRGFKDFGAVPGRVLTEYLDNRFFL